MHAGILLLLLTLGTAVAHADEGARLFNRVCAACHMPDARGVENTFPELREHVACEAQRSGGREYLAGVLKHGLEGPISVDGTRVDGYMPMATQLSSAQKAAVLNYVVSLSSRCVDRVAPFTAAEVDAALDDPKWNSETLHDLRESILGVPSAGENWAPRSDLLDSSQHLDRAAEDFTLFCQGCHTPRGEGVPGKVPALRGNLGFFLRSASGRAFLVKVPGVAFAPLDDVRLANLLNWVIRSFAVGSTSALFFPYGADEVAAYRREPFVDVDAARASIVASLSSSDSQILQ
jgi:mono/diheme cytochrome c family protein